MSCNHTEKLRSEFEAQVKDADEKIAKVREELVRLNEYRTKLQGGLETLGLLDEQNGSHEHPETAAPEAVTDTEVVTAE